MRNVILLISRLRAVGPGACGFSSRWWTRAVVRVPRHDIVVLRGTCEVVVAISWACAQITCEQPDDRTREDKRAEVGAGRLTVEISRDDGAHADGIVVHDPLELAELSFVEVDECGHRVVARRGADQVEVAVSWACAQITSELPDDRAREDQRTTANRGGGGAADRRGPPRALPAR